MTSHNHLQRDFSCTPGQEDNSWVLPMREGFAQPSLEKSQNQTRSLFPWEDTNT